MRENSPRKHCDTCRYAYLEPECAGKRDCLRQRCGSPEYNAPTYTHDMLMEDWGRGHCRFWSPKQ
ncbi:MAG: hypothetical protein NC311_19665 [Muribaculaceae bacterium]|nr:hypothetical protein [Muribaculaceae bacterium]